MLASKLLSACGSSETLYVDDVFQTVTRTGTGATATITTGFQPDLLISKSRGNEGGAWPWAWVDSPRGINAFLSSNQTDGNQVCTGDIGSFGATGYTLNAPNNTNNFNRNGTTYVDLVFAKKAKFFDCGTYTGTGGTLSVSHSLGIKPGLIITKATSGVSGWAVYHQSLTATQRLRFDSTSAATTSGSPWGNTEPTATQLTVNNDGDTNAAGVSYVWYAFAHDTSAEGIIQCGSFTTDASGNATVNLGWEPQFLTLKTSSTTSNWYMLDSMRGFTAQTSTNYTQGLYANTSGAEWAAQAWGVTPTGFQLSSAGASTTYIYLAIRRSNKPPTTGTQVYNAIARTGTGAAATVTGVGFAPDLVLSTPRAKTGSGNQWPWRDRLRGPNQRLRSAQTDAEGSATDALTAFLNDGVSFGSDATEACTNESGQTFINHFFRRAPGVFDICAYSGTGSATTVAHNLGVAPELMIVKARNTASTDWWVYSSALGTGFWLRLNATLAAQSYAGMWTTAPTASNFGLQNDPTNFSAYTYIAYLFASSPGIQYINSYVGDGTTGRVINCGFTAGARFVCIKATSTTGDWLIADTARGLVAGNDPRLSLNSTASEVTSEDWLDPHSSGFIVNQVSGSNANVNGVTYLVWAIA